MESAAQRLLSLPSKYSVPPAPDLLYSHRLRTSQWAALARTRRALAGFELDTNLIKEHYRLQHQVPPYRLALKLRRTGLIALTTAAVVVTAAVQVERLLDWIEYEVYIK